MAEEITRRLLLKEDISFDTDGTGATTEVENPAGGTLNGHKVNAGHIPITTALRAMIADATTVEEAITYLYEYFFGSESTATTERSGTIEIATLAEAQAGTDTLRAITPYLFKAVKASATQFGTITLASDTEARAGEDGEKAITAATLAAKLANFVAGVEYGMESSINSTDSSHDIDISAGVKVDSTHSYAMTLGSLLTKQIDVNWTAGTNNGGFPTGITLSSDTWYYIFAIYNPDDDIADAGFDSDIDAANLLADATGYTKYCVIGKFLTDGSANISYIQMNLDVNREIAAYGVVSDAGAKLSGSDNWTVAKNSTGNYQLNITDAGNYIVMVGKAYASATASMWHAVHDTATGIFSNNTASNVIFQNRHDGSVAVDSYWLFYAIKL